MKKTVLLPIEVPEGDYCWDLLGDRSICEYFDNWGGSPSCKFEYFWGTSLEYDKEGRGVRKPKECLNLKKERV
jgi:hypothetical protein